MNKYTCVTPSKESIIKEYVEKPEASITTASKALGITRKVLWRCLKTYGIEAKSKGRKGIAKKGSQFNVDSFKEEYYNSGITLSQYAKKLGVGSDTLSRWIKDNGLTVKPKKGNYYKHPTQDVLLRITKEDIERVYLSVPDASLESAGKILKVSRNALGKAIRQLGLKTKPRFRLGEYHPNWNGGTSYNPDYPWSFKQTRKRIIERDGNKCAMCQKTRHTMKHSMQYKRDLAVHHIDYNKSNSDEKNLVALCYSCHGKTNYNRESWIPFFKTYIQNLYEKNNNF